MKRKLADDRPIFHQIRDMIEEEILDGTIEEGDKIPSTNELASFYKINPATAAKGIQALVDKEIIFKRRGIGMFVADGAKERLVKERKQQFKQQFIQPLLYEAKRLQLSKKEVLALFEEEGEK
ncbi:GntR family transcriptional regulator [Evansella cellulosilytica]|uniref:Transcriptional regulator, GntR family n=1 Tax=Evansella cellulosilytica (strain ATCC 21833 / DSM 2522 / FERM P-1141 / JCM 9156 / N-4) TaxID=649639 RepID=E6U221_EVAC2|nr:GntR family transcriptional regulator [Evansella cellulosilytica]ADU29265.1 transcriptional regulator, GntR family [Evansella cellulosilytica DSM 2522]